MGLRPGQAKAPWVGTDLVGPSYSGGSGIDVAGTVISGRHDEFLDPDRWVIRLDQYGSGASEFMRYSEYDSIVPGVDFKSIVFSTRNTNSIYALTALPGLWSASPSFVYKAETWHVSATLYWSVDTAYDPSEPGYWNLDMMSLAEGSALPFSWAAPTVALSIGPITSGTGAYRFETHRFEYTGELPGSDRGLALRLNCVGSDNPSSRILWLYGLRLSFHHVALTA